MTAEERVLAVAKGEKCKARGCKCLARCYHIWNKYWMARADVCTHPNFVPADTEWHGDQPPFVGNKPKPRPPLQLMKGNKQ